MSSAGPLQTPLHDRELQPKLQPVKPMPDRSRQSGSIRRSGQAVDSHPFPSVCLADIPQPSAWDRCCPPALQQYWQQSRRSGSMLLSKIEAAVEMDLRPAEIMVTL